MPRRQFVPALALVLVLPAALALTACAGSSSMIAKVPAPSPQAQQPGYVMASTPCAPPVASPCDPCAAPPMALEDASRPPDAAPGEVWCYIRVPAVTQTISEQVLVTPGGCREEWVPPVTQEVTEQVCVKPEQRVRVPVPAEFNDQVEQVLVCDSKTEWRKVDCTPKNMSQGEQVGECWTLVQIPPQYTTRTVRVCVKPETCREEVIAAEYAQQSRTVTVSEGYMKRVEIPPVYEVREREVEISPARWEWRRTSECEVPEAAVPAAPAEPAPTPAPAEPAPTAPPAEPAPVAAPTPTPAPLPSDPPVPVPSPGIPDAPAFDAPPAGELPPVPTDVPLGK
jgi:hypothetical protein